MIYLEILVPQNLKMNAELHVEATLIRINFSAYLNFKYVFYLSSCGSLSRIPLEHLLHDTYPVLTCHGY